MNTPLISIIILAYKVEPYLEECVRSVINQTYKNIEIILVDDGSPDNCPQIIDQLAATDNRIIAVHKQNGGIGSARNAGLEKASGDYIGFVDGDDIVDPDMFRYLLNGFNNYKNAGIVSCSFSRFYENSNLVKQNTKWPSQTEEMDAEQIHIKIISDEIKNFVWNKLYKKELLSGINFKVGYNNEDTVFNYQVTRKMLGKEWTAVLIPQSLYQYRIRSTSLVRNKVDIFEFERFKSLNWILDDMGKENSPYRIHVEKLYIRSLIAYLDIEILKHAYNISFERFLRQKISKISLWHVFRICGRAKAMHLFFLKYPSFLTNIALKYYYRNEDYSN